MAWSYEFNLSLRQRFNTVGGLSAIRKALNRWSNNFQTIFSSSVLAAPAEFNNDSDVHARHVVQIEDYPSGYPRFSALIASHNSFHIYRRFLTLRARLLLLKQDRLSQLERRLQVIDQEETNLLRLGSNRNDNNAERQLVISEVDSALADYDGLIERSCRIFGMESAKMRNVVNLRNWVDGNGCIAREETAYLACTEDLASVPHTDDTAMTWLETMVEDGHGYFPMRTGHTTSRDPNIYIPSQTLIARRTRVLMAPIIVSLLLTPVIICNSLVSMNARLVTIVIATTIFVTTLAASTKAKTIELVVGGATYITVLVVFITSSNFSE